MAKPLPFNRKSMSDLATDISSKCMAATRAQQVAGGVTRTAQQISRGGPQNIMELMAFEELTGFKGGSIEDFESALVRLEKGDFEEGAMERLQARFAKAGGGGAGG